MTADVQCRTCDHVFPCPALARCELCGSTYLKPYNPCEAMAEAVEGIRADIKLLRSLSEGQTKLLSEVVAVMRESIEETMVPL